jgi:hypothetical protein
MRSRAYNEDRNPDGGRVTTLEGDDPGSVDQSVSGSDTADMNLSFVGL